VDVPSGIAGAEVSTSDRGVDAGSGKEAFRYWLVVLILVAFVLLSPFRTRPRVFLPGLALFLGLLVGYVLVAPWTCAQSFSSNPTTGEETLSPIVCTSPTGIEYSGSEPFDPSRTPALLAGAATGAIAAGVTWVVARSRIEREPAPADR
jgi:hypothetical protein